MSNRGREEIGAEDWAGEMGERWLANLKEFETMIAPVGEALLEAAAFLPGERVLDLGCGGGGTTVAIAQKVGETGHATGLDISPALADAAKKRAAEAGVANVDFIVGDGATVRLEPESYDTLFSRFGNMFFEEPVAAFSNLRAAIKSGGRAIFSCWAPAPENPWILEVLECVSRQVALPPPVPHAPGPFAFDDPAYVKDVLTKAGFSDIEVSTWQGMQYVGGKGATPDSAARFVMTAMAVSETLKDEPEDVRETVKNDIAEKFSKFATPEGILMPGKAWFVSAKAG